MEDQHAAGGESSGASQRLQAALRRNTKLEEELKYKRSEVEHLKTVIKILLAEAEGAAATCSPSSPAGSASGDSVVPTPPPSETRAPSSTTLTPSSVTLAPSSTTLATSDAILAPSGAILAPSSATLAPSSTTLTSSSATLAPSSATLVPSSGEERRGDEPTATAISSGVPRLASALSPAVSTREDANVANAPPDDAYVVAADIVLRDRLKKFSRETMLQQPPTDALVTGKKRKQPITIDLTSGPRGSPPLLEPSTPPSNAKRLKTGDLRKATHPKTSKPTIAQPQPQVPPTSPAESPSQLPPRVMASVRPPAGPLPPSSRDTPATTVNAADDPSRNAPSSLAVTTPTPSSFEPTSSAWAHVRRNLRPQNDAFVSHRSHTAPVLSSAPPQPCMQLPISLSRKPASLVERPQVHTHPSATKVATDSADTQSPVETQTGAVAPRCAPHPMFAPGVRAHNPRHRGGSHSRGGRGSNFVRRGGGGGGSNRVRRGGGRGSGNAPPPQRKPRISPQVLRAMARRLFDA